MLSDWEREVGLPLCSGTKDIMSNVYSFESIKGNKIGLS